MKIKEKLAVMTGTALFLSFGVFLSISAAVEAAPVSVPTMNEWGMIIFSLFMAGLSLWFIRKQNKKSC